MSSMHLGQARSEEKNSHDKMGSLCQPKDKGGLGLKKAADMNKAMLAKANWRLLTRREHNLGGSSERKVQKYNALRSDTRI